MKSTVKAGFLFIGMLMLLVACGGGGGGSTPTTLVSGIASKGTIVGGTVKAYSIVSGVQVGNTAVTGSNGTYSIDVGGFSGPLKVEVTGGTYVDEATGTPTELVSPLRVFVANVVSGTPLTAAITPLTEIAARYAERPGSTLTTDNINAANTKISTEFNVTDILTTSPSTDAAYLSSLSAISALSAGSSLDAALTSLNNNIVSSGSLATTVAVTKDKASALIGGSEITLTVSVLPVPEANTPVDFTITSGVATFDNGLDTSRILSPSQQVKMKSNVAGSVTVTATCQTVSSIPLTVNFVGSPTVTVTADTTTAVASGTDPISLTATFSPVQPAGTDVTFTVPANAGKFSNGLTSIVTKVGTSNSAQTTVYSTTVGSVAVSAACQGGSGTSPSLSFTQGVSAYSSLLTALGPVFVLSSYDSSMPEGTVVNFAATGSATIKAVDGTWSKGGTYLSTIPTIVSSAGSYPWQAVVYLKCNSAGAYTVTATRSGSSTPIGSETKTCLAATGTSPLNIHLTPAGIGKLGGKQVTRIMFNIIAAPSSSTSSIVSRSSSFTISAVEQKTGVSTFVNLAPNAVLTSTATIFTATYGYNPTLPSFSIVPVGTVTFSDASTPVTLLSSDFEIR